MISRSNLEAAVPQVAVISNYTLIAAIYCAVFFILHSFLGQWFLSVIYGLSFITVVINHIVLQNTKNYERAISVVLSVGTVVITSLFATGGYENTGYLWIYPYVTFVFFISKDLAACLFWTLLLAVACLAVFIFHKLGLLQLAYSCSLLLHLFFSLFVMVVLAVIFQKARINYEYLLSYTKRLMDSAIEPVITFNSDGNIVDVNEATCLITGTTKTSLLNTELSTHFENKEKAKELFNSVFQKKSIQNAPMAISNGNGFSHVLCSVNVFGEENAEKKQALLFLKDITEIINSELKIKEYATNLERKNKELSQYAHIVSHDLKAPLRGISSLTEWIKEDLGEDLSSEGKKNLELLQVRVKRMQALITGILEYSKIGRIQVPIEEVDVNSLLNEIIDLFFLPAKFSVHIQQGLPSFKTEKIVLQQVFSNLISNAIKYNDKTEGQVIISMIDLGNFYQFSVADNGPGIASEYYSKVFDIFQTIEARDKIESTGIGLSIVKKIIDEKGGKIWIEPAKEGGTKFLFTWPKGDRI